MIRWTKLEDNNEVVCELYDYEEDPLETKNVAEEEQVTLKSLENILNEYPRAAELN